MSNKGTRARALRFPAPFFGGKSKVASLVWSRLGDVSNYIEAFAGSAAVLLARPHPPRVETVNDINCDFENTWRATDPESGNPGAVADVCCEIINDLDPYLVNVWRSLQADPETTAQWADHPVNEAYLHAIHRWLVLGEDAREFRQRMRTDPDFYDAKRAGRYLFGACAWIGGGFCQSLDRPERHQNSGPDLVHPVGKGVAGSGKAGPPGGSGDRSIYLGTGGADGNSPCPGRGVHAAGRSDQSSGISNQSGGSAEWEQRPQLEDSGGRGVLGDVPDAHRPQLADAYSRGRGVHNDNHLSQQRPQLDGTANGGISNGGVPSTPPEGRGTCAQRRAWLVDWFGRLRDRLRTVRVCCGHWLRVCDSESVTTRLGTVGLFLDPPYPTHHDGQESRSGSLYATDGSADDLDTLRDEILAYCLARGSNPRMRIAVACYEGDGYEALLSEGWTVEAWEAQGGYGNRSKK